MATTHENAAPKGGEFLTFHLGEEEYGIDILLVQEIRNYEQPTKVPGAPAFVRGVVNLRGMVVPIIDLRRMLGFEKVEYNAFTVVVVLSVHGRVVGAVVDSVNGVLELNREQIKPAPQMKSSIDVSFITGIGTIKNPQTAEGEADAERMLILVDIKALLEGAGEGLG